MPKCRGAGYLPTKSSASVSPVCTQTGDGPCPCTARPCVCKQPRGCEGAACATGGACVRALHAHAQLQACVSPPATAATVAHCSHVHTLTRVCSCACKPLCPGHLLPQGHSGWSLGSPQSWCHPPGWVCAHTRTHSHTRVCSDAPSPTQQPWEKFPQVRGSHAAVAG